MAEPTAYEQYMLELVNRARLDPAGEAERIGIDLNAGLSPGTLSSSAKQPLAFNPDLIEAARDHSAWMIETGTFSHTGAGGSSPGERMSEAGYSFTGAWSWGENIASSSVGPGDTMTAITERHHVNLFKSAGHRANLLNDTFREAGIGHAVGPYGGGSDRAMTTQDFAKSGTLPFLTGVAFDEQDGDLFYDPGEGLGGIAVALTAPDGTSYTTTTWEAGGYQLQVPSGTYQLTFSGGGLSAPVTHTVSIDGRNVKQDLTYDVGTTVPPTPAPQPEPQPDPAPPPAPPPVPGSPGIVRHGNDAPNVLAGTAGDDQLHGHGGNDLLWGRAGGDRLYGDGGHDRVYGQDGHDKLYGGSGHDRIFGGTGNDWIDGGTGIDQLTGGTGADRFVYRAAGEGGDTIVDFSVGDGDKLDLSRLMDKLGVDCDPYVEGYLQMTEAPEGVLVGLDTDGGGDSYTTFLTLADLSLAEMEGALIFV